MSDITRHTYAATAGYRPITVTGGDISLDVARAPHVSGSLSVALPSTSSLAGYDTGVQLIPGGGLGGVTPNLARRIQYVVDSTDPNDGDVRKLWENTVLNDQNSAGTPNMRVSIDRLADSLPKSKRISLVVGWFLDFDDLTCRPMVEQHEYANTSTYQSDGVTHTRNVRGNITISQAQYAAKVENGRVKPGVELVDEWSVAGLTRNQAGYLNVVYGETPSDQDVIDTVRYLTGRGYQVDLYPFLFGYEDDKPWRGRLTLNSSAEMTQFITGEWGYRRFIQHYINLIRDNSLDIHTMFVGSEMRGATYSLPAINYPFVDELLLLANYCKAQLPGVLCTYAADWSEYHSDPADYTARPLDRLWASDAIDFVSIDAYFPLTASHSADYATIKAGWTSGEAYDYWVDYGAPGNPHYDLTPDNAIKNVGYWWANTHTDRGAASPWIPKSKPIFFSEIGFATVNGTTNQPNVFVDPSSSESAYPRGSNKSIDFEVQIVALRATLDWLNEQPWSMTTPAHIWCWDTRPYPTFPNPDIWSDSGNWITGHWIDGKVNETALDALDPRTGNRVRLTATRTDQDGNTQRRVFDLGVRESSITHKDSEISVSLASDEALLGDYAPLTDDEAPYWLGDSVKALTNYVLDKALGATLDAATDDAVLPVVWSTTNLLPNPRTPENIAYYAATGATLEHSTLQSWFNAENGNGSWTGRLLARFTALDWSIRALNESSESFDVQEGEWRAFTTHVRRGNNSGVAARAALSWRDQNGRILSRSLGTLTTIGNTAWQTLMVSGKCPPGATGVTADIIGTSSATTGRALYVSASMLHPDRMPGWYFDGSRNNDGVYEYEWLDEAHKSASRRTALIDGGSPDMLVWRAGVDALAFLSPIVQAAGLRLVCDEARRWTLRADGWTPGGSLAITHTRGMLDGGDRISREADEWFDAAITVYTWQAGGREHQRIDAWALTSTPTKTRVFEKNTPYPGPGFSEYAVKRARGKGRETTAATISDWSARAEQPISVTLPGQPARAGRIESVRYSLDNDEMSLAMRDLT